MKTVRKYLEQKQAEFNQHPFFSRLRAGKSLDELASFAQRLTFWVMSFQDILQFNTTQIDHPKLYEVAHRHQREDSGHEEWFLNDLNKIFGEQPSLISVYSQEHAPIRYASYMLVSEVFRARNDFERIALLLTLESTAEVFFEHIASFSERVGSSSLLYFSNNHLNAEESHESFDSEVENWLDGISLSPAEEKSIFDLIDRAYKAFTAMFDDFEAALKRRVEIPA